ncbi:MAG: hypothetical protein AAF581_16880 [Planctomycetota bacterium]
MPDKSPDEETPFLALARTHRVADACNAAREVLAIGPQQIDVFESLLRDATGGLTDSFATTLAQSSLPRSLIDVCLLSCWLGTRTAWEQSGTDALEAVATAHGSAYGRWLSQVRQAELFIADSKHSDAESLVAESIDMLEAQADGVIRDHCLSLFFQLLGNCREARFECRGARDALARASQIENSRRFGSRWCTALHYAGLLRERGQYEDALTILTSEALRTDAAKEERRAELAALHLSAVRAASAAADSKLAFREVMAADEILHRDAATGAMAQCQWLQGELLLCSGLVEQLLDNHDEAEDLLRAAAAAFVSSDGYDPCGHLEAWIVLAEGSFRRAGARELYDEIADVIGNFNGPYTPAVIGRLIALETFRFAGDHPPPTERYRQLLKAAKQIISPELAFRALANLYQYAIGFLDQFDQASLLVRLRKMADKIEPDTFPSLYQRLVTDRYQYAVEARLDRHSRGKR